MIITEIIQQKQYKGRFSIFIDSKYSFSLDDIDLYKLGLKVGQSITQDNLDVYIQRYEISKAKEKALNYIAFKSRTYKETLIKLQKCGFNDKTIENVMDYLVENNFINDDSFSEIFINDHIKLKAASKRAIKQKLLQKGVNTEIIDEKLENAAIDEFTLACSLIEKKANKISNLDKKQLSKLYNMLIRKGFSNEIALRAIKSISSKA